MVRPSLAPRAHGAAPRGRDRTPGRVVGRREARSPRLGPAHASPLVKVKPLLEEEARERMLAGKTLGASDPRVSGLKGKSNDLAGARVGISGMSVKRAARVVRDGVPALADAVRAADSESGDHAGEHGTGCISGIWSVACLCSPSTRQRGGPGPLTP